MKTSILLGPAGSAGLGNEEGLKEVKRLGLEAMEIEFTYGVRMTNEEAKRIGDLAKKLRISLSVHCPYYINLNSEENRKIEASKKRILDSCERAHYLGAEYVVFHAGFYGKKSKEETFKIIKKKILDIHETIKKNNWRVVLCPETTGKIKQFGDLDELLRLSEETGCGVCIDFSHIKARNKGNIDYDNVCRKIKRIKNKTAHFSGIEWGEGGEKRHIITSEEEIITLLQHLKKYNISIRIINESPDPFGDSIKSKKIREKIMV
ncbi:MAG: TIM barrel protein [Candidatus Woesearchaeota archaeon]